MQQTHHNVELHEASYLSLTVSIYAAVDTYLLGLPAIKRDQLPMYTFGVIDYGKNCSEYKQKDCPDSKVHWANMGPIWGRQDPGGPHVGPMNLAIWVCIILVRYGALYKEFSAILCQTLFHLQEHCVYLCDRVNYH